MSMVGLCSCVSPKQNQSYKDLYSELTALQKTVSDQSKEIETQKKELSRMRKQVRRAKASIQVSPLLNDELGSDKGAQSLFKQFLQASEQENLPEMKRLAEVLRKGYPSSPLAINALNQVAETYFKNKQYAQSAKTFESIYKAFPDSNKSASILYGLILSYKELGRETQAKVASEILIKTYPGSREAQHLRKDVNKP